MTKVEAPDLARPTLDPPAIELAPPTRPAPEPEVTAPPGAESAPSRWSPPTRSSLATVLILLALVAAITAILYAWQLPPFGGHIEQTDDAYVRGQTTVISPQVAGYVSQIPVKDFQDVRAGDVLVRIEDSIYAARVAQARANVLTQISNLDNSQ